jgi:hypothetical protein
MIDYQDAVRSGGRVWDEMGRIDLRMGTEGWRDGSWRETLMAPTELVGLPSVVVSGERKLRSE